MAKITQKEGATKKLSKGLLEMKFMKKSKEKVEKEMEAEETETLFSVPARMKVGSKLIIESSYIPCEDLLVGRFSFKGMNPEIESIMQKEREAKLKNQKSLVQVDEQADVTDNEMAQHFSSLVTTIGNKFRHNRQRYDGNQPGRNKKKYTFLKPQE